MVDIWLWLIVILPLISFFFFFQFQYSQILFGDFSSETAEVKKY